MSRRNCVLVAEDSVWKPNDVGSPYPPIYYITERFIGSEGQEQRAVIASFTRVENRDNIQRAMQLMGAVQPQETARNAVPFSNSRTALC